MAEELKKFGLKDFFVFLSYPIRGVLLFFMFFFLYYALSTLIGCPDLSYISSMPTSPIKQVLYMIVLVISDLVTISPVLIFGLNGNGFTWESVGLKPIVINWKRIGQIAIIAISIVLFEILAMLVLEHFNIGIPRFSRLGPLETIVSNNFFLFVIFVFFLGILVPIIEEIYFRGFVYGWLRKYFRPWVGILVSSAIFSLLHFKSPVSMAAAFVYGIVLAYLYERDKTLVSPIVLHASINTLLYFVYFYIP